MTKKDLKPTSGWYRTTLEFTNEKIEVKVKNLKVSTIQDDGIDAWYGSFDYDIKSYNNQPAHVITFDNGNKTYTGVISPILSYPGNKKCEVWFKGITPLYDLNAEQIKYKKRYRVPRKYKTPPATTSVGEKSTLDIKYNDGTTEIIETSKWILHKSSSDFWHGGLDYKIDISKVHSAVFTGYHSDKHYYKGRVILVSDKNEFDPAGNRPGVIFQGVNRIKEKKPLFQKHKKSYEEKIMEQWYGPQLSPSGRKVRDVKNRVKGRAFNIFFMILIIIAILIWLPKLAFCRLFGLEDPPDPISGS